MIGPAILSMLLMASEVLADDRSCHGELRSPLKKTLHVNDGFEPKRSHFGLDYRSNGDEVLSVKDGTVLKVGAQMRALSKENPRTGLKKQGYGTYVLLSHADGSQSLYAHLEPESVAKIKVGDQIKAGQKLGLSDSSGAVTGPHLHFEYANQGNLFDKKNKINPDLCVLRTGMISLESYPAAAKGICQVLIDNKLIGENLVNQKAKFTVNLLPGKHVLRVLAKQVVDYKKTYCAIELGESLTILDDKDGDIGPGLSEELEQAQSLDAVLQVQ